MGRLTKTILAMAAAARVAFPASGQADDAPWLERVGAVVNGFADVRWGTRLRDDPHEGDTSLSEARFQFDATRMGDRASVEIRGDLVYDEVADDYGLDLEEGRGWLDLREANVSLVPLEFMDVKVGRQILTWGKGDLLFINDLFPKDWQSFFTGRDEEYLKAPSDAALVSVFSELVNLDVAYTPRFDADRYISGERLSYWNPLLGDRAGRNAVANVDRPDEWFEDGEVAVRAARLIGSYDVALYVYDGRWKSPVGLNPATTNATFPELSVYGASVQGPLVQGVVSVETGYYDSREDRGGDSPLIPNSELRFLIGYERELARNFTGSVQYYLERMQAYGAYRAALPAGYNARDEYRQVVTVRLTELAMNQDLTLSLFAYYSPTDQDAYLRPSVTYRANDHWTFTAGGNVFTGSEPYTFFGQFEDNTNVYGGARYSF